ncbi:MAG: hypothetical protein R3F20_11065 [Planctomycetota bacterium]
MRIARPLPRHVVVLGLALLLGLGASLASIVVPAGLGADEEDHLDYALALAYAHHLPDPRHEAVGQIQHPPLAHAMLGLVWRAAAEADPVPEDEDPAAGRRPPERRGARLLGRVTTYDGSRRRIDDLGIPASEARGIAVDPRTRALFTQPRRVFQVLRATSVLLGVLTALFAGLALLEAFPERPGLALGLLAALLLSAQAAVAFGTVSNDALVAALGALASWLALRARRRGTLLAPRTVILLGVVLGAAFLTKLHALGPAVFVGLLVLGERGASPRRRALAFGALVALCFVLAGWWHVRQWVLLGSPLAVEHHLRFHPALLRLGTPRWSLPFDYLDDLGFSFFGRFGQEKVETHRLLVLPLLALVVVGLAGLLTTRRGEGEDRPAAPRPVLAALLSVFGLVIVIGLANRTYYHVHGRYLLGVIVPLAIAIGAGLERLAGRRAGTLALLGGGYGAAVALVTLVAVLLPRYSIPVEKVDRGRVHRYFDCGLPPFDQAGAGGLISVASGGRLGSAARDTLRWAPQLTPEPEIRYVVTDLDPERRYQVRVSYPRPAGPEEGDLPAPSAIALVGDSWLLHHTLSLWPELGEQRHDVPAPVTADGRLELWWQNHHPAVNAVGVAEIWIEETWLAPDGAPRLDANGELVVTLVNRDAEAAHRAHLFLERAGVALARWPATEADPFVVPAGGRLELRLATPPGTEGTGAKLRLVDADLSPWSSLKLAHWRGEGVPTGARRGAPDLVTLRLDQDEDGPEREVAVVPLARIQAGAHRLSISFPRGDSPFASGLATLEVRESDDGPPLELRPEPGPREAGYGEDLDRMSWVFEKATPGETPLTIRIRATGRAGRLELDRLILERRPEHPGTGHSWPLAP